MPGVPDISAIQWSSAGDIAHSLTFDGGVPAGLDGFMGWNGGQHAIPLPNDYAYIFADLFSNMDPSGNGTFALESTATS